MDDCEIEVMFNCPQCATPIVDIVKFGEGIDCPNPDCNFWCKVIIGGD